MPNGMLPREAAVATTDALTDEEVMVEASGVDTSDHVFFAGNRWGLRLQTRDGKVFVFAFSRDAQQKLKDELGV
jgi:hypothetical protein